jgi:phospholipase C
MQENRAFDHDYGMLRGVRGFGDSHPIVLPSGQPVWNQADGSTVTQPFRPDVGNLALTFIEDLDHSWDGTHEMFNNGNWDQWVPAKTTTCMAHMKRSDLPFHYALADAFTVCDAYHAQCSVQPIPSATTCGPAGTATTVRPGADLTAGRQLPLRARRTA